jgi:uncharacterized protein YcbK (DUF882 family)
MHPQLISALEGCRLILLFPIRIISGFRCLDHNNRVGEAPESRHLYAEAADIQPVPNGPGPLKLLTDIVSMTPAFAQGGIGIYESFIHVDVRWVSGMPKARW